MVIVTGVDLNEGIIYTNNPWGVQGRQTFEEFQDCFATKWYHSEPEMDLEYVVVILY